MDDVMVTEVRRRMAYERARTTPPEDFPKLPDLPLGRYTHPVMFEAEQELLRRSWLFAGHVSEFGAPGSYRVLDIPLAPIIIARGSDGVLRGFLNACRHRGAPVVREVAGTARLLVCQYHSWSYDLTGRLVHVPDERDFVGLQAEERALTPVRCESWGGFVFVNLDQGAAPLAEWLAPITRRLPEIAAAPLRVVDRSSYEVRCNWKIMAEGFLEVYHAKTIHPRTVAQLLDPSGAVMELYPNGHTGMITPYLDRVAREGRDTVTGIPRIAGLGEIFWTSNPAFGLFPNLITPLEASGFPFLVFWPLAVDRTLLEIVWFGADWGDGPRPEEWERRLDAFSAVMDEDRRNLEPIQGSVEAAAHAGIPLNYQERRIWHFHATLDKAIKIALPEELRVPDLLRAYVED